ncbi:hypothetical protein Tco_1364198 [Tanacetum coccineum]
MNAKMNDPIAVANKQTCWTVDYKQLNALYNDFVPQKESFVEQTCPSIKKTRSQTQKEMDELIAHVSEKTYAYGAIRAENQNLLVTISELKARMKNAKNGKSVNTKFDKTHGS